MKLNIKFKHVKKITGILGILLIIAACQKKEIDPVFTPTMLSNTIEDLYVDYANPNKDTVMVYLHGGPVFSIDNNGFSGFTDNPNYHQVYAHQVQTFNSALENAIMTFEEATIEADKSAEILHRVITHFKDQGKIVYAVTHSYGSFIAPRYIDKYGIECDEILIMAGRLKFPDFFWEGFRDGIVYNFPNNDGVTAEIDTNLEADDPFNNKNAQLLAAALGQYNYLEDLADRDLTKLSYIYGAVDQAVGKLSSEEITVAEGLGATILGIPNGDHSSMFNPQVIPTILQGLITPN